jgi:hypothetical protein
MDAQIFDAIVRTLAGHPNRRGVLRGLVASTLAATALRARGSEGPAACGKAGDRCSDRSPCCAGADCVDNRCQCAPDRADCDGDGTCETNVRQAREHCGGCGNACPAGEICADGICVTGQGSCAATEDACAGPHVPCNPDLGCICVKTKQGGRLRCARGTNCGQRCVRDQECADLGPGAFCARDSDGFCCDDQLPRGKGFCAQPCPNCEPGEVICPPGARIPCCPPETPTCCPLRSIAECCPGSMACCREGSGQACCPADRPNCCPAGYAESCCPPGTRCRRTGCVPVLCEFGAGEPYCPRGSDLCRGDFFPCGENCKCFQDVRGDSFCGLVPPGCFDCARNADCGAIVPGAVCIQCALCPQTGGRACAIPCPD